MVQSEFADDVAYHKPKLMALLTYLTSGLGPDCPRPIL